MSLQFPATQRLNPASRSVRMAAAEPESKSTARTAWEFDCARRLRELRPADDPASIASVVAQLWVEVGRFDPYLAAEMEHESGL